jgi:thiamine kinase-like enzyme
VAPTADDLPQLAFWRRPIKLEPLGGGITNRNYRVDDAAGSYVARLCDELPHLGIDRRNESLCQRLAAAAGVAPPLLHEEKGLLVSAYLPCRTLTPEAVREPGLIGRLAAALRRLHGSWDMLSGELLYFSPFQTVRTYARTARDLGARLPPEIDDLLEDSRRLAHQVAPFRPALCHNDLLAANLLDDGERLWLVDWEYAGIGNPLFDLAGVAGNCAFDDALEEALLREYLGREDEGARRDLRILKTVSLLREALWALIQTVKSEIDFDYGKYAAGNFAAYREARAKLP